MEGLFVYDPIHLENIPMNDYLMNDTNNVVFILNKKAYGVNKALFMFNNEMKRCLIKNKALLKQATYDNSETFYNIGYFIGKKVIVNRSTLNNVLKTHRVMELTSKTTGDTYINKELLELTTIGLLKQSEDSIGKVNFKHAFEDVYFDELISKLLEEYSWLLYKHINNSLLNPELYNNNEPLKYELISVLKHDFKARNKKIFKNIDFKKAIDKVITNIDRVFIEAAPRYEKTYIHKVFYRGMRGKYGNELENVGDTSLILNYTSVSSAYTEAQKFAGKASDAVIYNIYLEEGMPYINMVSTAIIKQEEEYLLPRNIIFELISKKGNEYTVLAKPFKPDQFTIKTGCFPLDFYDIVPIVPTVPTMLSKPKTSSTPRAAARAARAARADSGKDKIIPAKLKRCPKGMMRNKITNECVPKNAANAAKPKPKQTTPPTAKAKPDAKPKLGRCPNGTRRNPITLLCEAKL